MPCPAVNKCCVVSCRLRLRCAASDCVGQCCVAPRCVLLLYCQWSVSCCQSTPCVQCRVVLWRCAADLEEQRAGYCVHAAAGRGQLGGGKGGRAVGGVVEVEAEADVTAPWAGALFQDGDAHVDVVQLQGALLELTHHVVSEAPAPGPVDQHAAPLVLLLHHEGGTLHARVAEANGFMQVVDAVQKVAVMSTCHAQDLVVTVHPTKLHEARAEVVHSTVDRGQRVR